MFRLGFMGQCYSSRNEPKLLKSRPASRLTTGDLLFLKEEGAKELYALRTHEGWTTFSHCGFVLRRGSSTSSILFCHADYISGPEGRFTQAVVRQLRVRLSPDQRDLLHEYVQLNLGKRSVTTTASVQMTGGLVVPRGDERLRCSEFVALMLHLLGLAEPDMPASFTYLATAGAGQLLHPPRDVELLLERRLSPEISAGLSPSRRATHGTLEHQLSGPWRSGAIAPPMAVVA
ncbi:hypothetical protein QBZ16_005314 [Prototheca wickerhamii]|uniref:Uncharacterized protein n=1 Tax=Prototheca wickerhamii TaxID=3111 RepID=A0AAD9IG80_PROWI|nr:hypothetical protein QBZ16_005314 [Prototheca wickerhamii]